MYSDKDGIFDHQNANDNPVRSSSASAMYAKAFAINPAAIGIVCLDNGLIVDVNETWQETFQCSRAGAIGRSALELQLWPSSEIRGQYLEELHRIGSFRNREYTVLRKSGESFTALCSAELMELQGEKFIVSTWLDISDRKRTEEYLKRNESLLSESQRIGHIGSWSREIGAKDIQWSDETYRIYGQDPATFHPTLALFVALIVPEDRALMKDFIRACEKGENPGEIEFRIMRPDGTVRILYGRGGLEVACDGKPLRILGMVQDISERKQAERAARESESRYRLIAENAADVIWVLDLETQRFKYVSPSVAKLRGYSPEEVMAQPVDMALTPESLKRVQELLALWIPQFIADPSIPGFATTEVDQPCKDGSIVCTEVTTNAVMSERGQVEIIGVSRDITERKRANEERARLSAQLQQAQKMESVGRLAGGVAHDFNNMLSVILGNVEIALAQTNTEPSLSICLEEIQKAGRRSANLTRQLLAFARKQAITPSIVDLNEAVSGFTKMLRRLIGENIVMEWKPSQDLWLVEIDPSQIDQILANLAVNARDAIAGIGTLTIETANIELDDKHQALGSGFVPGDYVQLSISDTGSGMDNETLKHIFEPFFTTKEIGKGTGLGLATVYGIVKQNNGYIDVCSQPGNGTQFEIYLPRFVGMIHPVSEENILEPPLDNPAKVLVVEDEPTVLTLATTMLEKLGYTALSATSAQDAISLLAHYPGNIDILLTDVIMPGMNGRELARRLLSDHPNLKCVFMSGWTADILESEGVIGPGIHFLQKPFTSDQLSSVLQNARRD